MRSYSERIKKKIAKMKAGSVITLESFPDTWSRNMVTRTLSRLNKEGLITRVKKGVYTNAKSTRFGPVRATSIEVVADEVRRNENKCFGGVFLYNNLGLTRQVPTVLEVLNNRSSYAQKLETITVRYVKIRPRIEQTTKSYIILLEVLKNLRLIPDSDVKRTFLWIKARVDGLRQKELQMLFKISQDYPPRVRAILGCLLSAIDNKLSEKILKSLNENSRYKVGSVIAHLQSPEKWRLINEAA